jgi:peptide/nickel transport system permease protein
MLEVLSQDYVRTARAKGLRDRAVLMRHALRNALIPLVTVIGINMGILLGGTAVIETVFVLPGVGQLVVRSLYNRDLPVIRGSSCTSPSSTSSRTCWSTSSTRTSIPG